MRTDHLYLVVYCVTLAGYNYCLGLVFLLLRVSTVSYYGKIEVAVRLATLLIDDRIYLTT